MDFPIHINRISMELPNGGKRSKFLNYNVFLFLKIVFILANSADPGEMPPYVAFHLGFHCLPKYLYINIQNENG